MSERDEAVERLRAFIRDVRPGGCGIYSQGAACQCPLCDVDRLALAWHGERHAQLAEALARQFHDIYERLAPSFGYSTREASRKPWADVPENNRALMTAVAVEILKRGEWSAPPEEK